MGLKVKDIYEQTGVEREALRFYEKKGLLPKPMRTKSGYREFPKEVVERINFIKAAKQVGFTLKEIRELIELLGKNIDCQEGREIAEVKKAEVLEKIDSMKEIVAQLDSFIKKCSGKGQTCSLSFKSGCKS